MTEKKQGNIMTLMLENTPDAANFPLFQKERLATPIFKERKFYPWKTRISASASSAAAPQARAWLCTWRKRAMTTMSSMRSPAKSAARHSRP